MTGWLDVHAHYVTDRYRKECSAGGYGEPDGMPGLPGWSVEAAAELMATAGIAAAVLSISSPGVHFGDDSLDRNQAARDLAAHVNDVGARIVAERPGQFGLSAILPLPDVDGALAELARAYDDLGADALALETNYHGRYLSDAAFGSLLAEMDSRGAVVTLHPTSPPGWELTALGRPRPMIEFLFDTTRCVVELALSGALARYPRIRWIVPHAGAVLPALAHRVTRMSLRTGTPVDLPDLLGGLHYDLAGAALPVALDGLLAVAGPDRLLYGSDFPFTPALAVANLATALRQAPALREARLGLEPDSPGAALFPRLLAAHQGTVLSGLAVPSGLGASGLRAIRSRRMLPDSPRAGAAGYWPAALSRRANRQATHHPGRLPRCSCEGNPCPTGLAQGRGRRDRRRGQHRRDTGGPGVIPGLCRSS